MSVAIAAAACSKAEKPAATPENQEPAMATVEFSAVFGEAPVVKTELSGNNVLWKANDEIKILWNGGSATAQADRAGATANFSAIVASASEYFAVYPSSATVSLNAEVLTVGIPSAQHGAFEDANIAIAKTSDQSLSFKNLCALGKFTLSRDDIAQVVFRGQAGENLAGSATLSISGEGVPTVSSTASPVDSIVLTPASGDAFAAGSYYFAVIPGALSSGISFTLTTVSGNTVLGKASANAAALNRSEALNFGTLDATGAPTSILLKFKFGPEAGTKGSIDTENNWPASSSSETLDKNYPYTLDSQVYNFFVKDLSADKKWSWRTNNSSGYADCIGIQTAPIYFGLPAISGYKLVKAVVGQCRRGAGDNAATKVTQIGITSCIPDDVDATKTYVSGGELQDWPGWPGTKNKDVVDHTFTLSGTAANTVYYLNSDTQAIGLYFARLALTYEKVNE